MSWSRDEYAALGILFGQRGSLLDEHLAAWEQVYAHTPASFDGVHYRFRDVYLEPKAYRPSGRCSGSAANGCIPPCYAG